MRLALLLSLIPPFFAVLLYVGTVKQEMAWGTPIVIDLNNNDKIDVTGHTSSRQKIYTLFSIVKFVEFDLDGDGNTESIDWVKGKTDGILLDLTNKLPKSGILSGKHLFGNGDFSDGFKKLKEFDKNSDRKLSGNELKDIAIWWDDGDAIFEDGELKSLSDYEITSISTEMELIRKEYGVEKMVGSALTSSGDGIYVEDVWFLKMSDLSSYDKKISSFLSYLPF